jgi:hypothetical protein
MVSRDFSQLPVLNEKRKIIGLVSLQQVQEGLMDGKVVLEEPVTNSMVRFRIAEGVRAISQSDYSILSRRAKRTKSSPLQRHSWSWIHSLTTITLGL